MRGDKRNRLENHNVLSTRPMLLVSFYQSTHRFLNAKQRKMIVMNRILHGCVRFKTEPGSGYCKESTW